MPQGPLPLRFSGVCPDANAQSQPTAHQFACSPDAQSGLNRPLPLRFSGVCPDANTQGQRTAHQFSLAPDAQSGLNRPLSLRFSGVCPDANTQDQRTAHQFALAPDAQSGLNKILKLALKPIISFKVQQYIPSGHLRIHGFHAMTIRVRTLTFLFLRREASDRILPFH